MPSKKNVREAAVQQLSPALGSEAVVAVAALGLEVLVAVVLVTVVVVTILVAAAGFGVGFVDGSAAGSPVAGSLPAASPAPPPGTSTPLASPADAVASTGSIVCVPSSKNRQIRLSNFDTLMLTASGRAGAVAAGPPAA